MKRLLILLFFILGGCSSEQSTTLPYPLVVSEDGLGSIHPNTPIDQIPTQMIGFEIEKLSAVSSADQAAVYLIKKNGNILAQIISDKSGKKIDSIHILSPLIKDTYDQTINMPLKEKSFLCEGSRCADPRSPQIFYTIDPKSRTILEITYQKL